MYNFCCDILGVSCMAAPQRENDYGHPEVRNKRKLRWVMDKLGNVAYYPNSPLHKRWMLPTVLLWLETGACRAVRELMTQARKQFSVYSLTQKKKKKKKYIYIYILFSFWYFWITLIYFQIKLDTLHPCEENKLTTCFSCVLKHSKYSSLLKSSSFGNLSNVWDN